MPTLPTLRGLWLLASGVFALVVANLINLAFGKPYWGITRHIELGSDDNAAAWYSSILLACGGLVILQCYQRAVAAKLERPWIFLIGALLVFGMSCDEIAQLHETVFGDIATVLGITKLDFGQNAGWVWVGGPFIAVVFGFVAWALHQHLRRVPGTTLLFLAGLGTMFAGGVVIESSINFLNHDNLQWVWDLEIVVEESLEMLGSIIVAAAFVKWRDAQSDVSVQLAAAKP
jgi:hypothetical protein